MSYKLDLDFETELNFDEFKKIDISDIKNINLELLKPKKILLNKNPLNYLQYINLLVFHSQILDQSDLIYLDFKSFQENSYDYYSHIKWFNSAGYFSNQVYFISGDKINFVRFQIKIIILTFKLPEWYIGLYRSGKIEFDLFENLEYYQQLFQELDSEFIEKSLNANQINFQDNIRDYLDYIKKEQKIREELIEMMDRKKLIGLQNHLFDLSKSG